MKKLVIAAAFALFVGAGCARQTETNTNTVSVTNTAAQTNAAPSANTANAAAGGLQWQPGDDGWVAAGNVPACPEPLMFPSPVDVTTVESVLYPGQTRGGQYKPHGGFRFAETANVVTVTVPMDAYVVQGSRYIEVGETQHLFDLITPCGIRFRFDHLRTLAPAFQALADTLPRAQEGDSRTTTFATPQLVHAGDVIATTVGFAATKNISFDFGVYDLRTKNTASQNANYAAAHDEELAQHAVCWFDTLPNADAARVKALPAADQNAGASSDYCTN